MRRQGGVVVVDVDTTAGDRLVFAFVETVDTGAVPLGDE